MIENEGVRVKNARCCFLCEDEGVTLYSDLRDRLFDAPGSWSLMQCPKCHLVWLDPQPIPDDIGRLYSQYFTHQVQDAPKRTLAGLRKSVKSSILQYSFGYQMEGSSKMLGSVLSRIGLLKDIAGGGVRYLKADEIGRLLDVGCGNGLFLDQMRQLGWEVMGVEPDGEAVSVAREKLGLEIFMGSLEETKFPDEHFDAITMNHVIEHVPDPIGLLMECHRILKPGGKMVVITPNIESLGAYHFGDSWIHWDPPRHLHLFSLKIIQACAEQVGLEVQKTYTTSISAHWVWSTSHLIRRNGTLPGGSPEAQSLLLRLKGLAFKMVEYGMGGKKELGEELVLVATK